MGFFCARWVPVGGLEAKKKKKKKKRRAPENVPRKLGSTSTRYGCFFLSFFLFILPCLEIIAVIPGIRVYCCDIWEHREFFPPSPFRQGTHERTMTVSPFEPGSATVGSGARRPYSGVAFAAKALPEPDGARVR